MIFLFISSKQKTTIQTIKINSWYWIVTMNATLSLIK